MSKATIKRFLMLLSSAKDLQREQLYQLLQKAEYCYCLKDRKGQYEFGKALSLFASPFDLIGDYYQSVYLHKTGHKQIAIEKLERVRQEAKGIYSDKAILTLSGMKEVDHDLDEALKLRLDLMKSEFLPIVVESAIGISAILSSQGEHDKAIEYLERVLPLLPKLGNMPLPFDVLNSYATELAEVGKIELASEVITPVIVSPYSAFYPNWPETAKEIQEKSSRKSMVTFNRSNVIPFPIREVEEAQEVEEPEIEEPQFPHARFITERFGIEDKIEDWIYGVMEPEDFSTLILALAESDDKLEREMILEKLVDSTFPHTEEGKDAKEKWRRDIVAKIRDEMKKPIP
jgi:hypothetical protein